MQLSFFRQRNSGRQKTTTRTTTKRKAPNPTAIFIKRCFECGSLQESYHSSVSFFAISNASTGQKHSGLGQRTPGCPSLGRQFNMQFIHCSGIASLPCTAPSNAPQIAALVSVSPPRITVSITPSSSVVA